MSQAAFAALFLTNATAARAGISRTPTAAGAVSGSIAVVLTTTGKGLSWSHQRQQNEQCSKCFFHCDISIYKPPRCGVNECSTDFCFVHKKARSAGLPKLVPRGFILQWTILPSCGQPFIFFVFSSVPALHLLHPERCRFMVYLMIYSLTIDIRKINQLKQLFG